MLARSARAMTKLHHEWKVLPHGRLKTVDDRILTVEGDIPMPLGKFPRRMTVVGLSRNRSVIFSGIPLGEAGMREVEAIGKPSFLIVPNAHHRLDAAAWKNRYPKLKVLCPPAARKAVSEAVTVDSTNDVLSDKDADFVIVRGTGDAEAALVVRRERRITLIVNDVVANVRNPRGLGAKLMARLLSFGVKRPQIPRIVSRALVSNRRELASQFRDWSDLPGLERLIPSHGAIIGRPVVELRRMAGTLG
jgi:hypothetical protein